MVDERGAIKGMKACPIELGVMATVRRRKIHFQISEVQKCVEDEVVQELVVVSTVLQV